jgi:hypothetical protein
MYKIFQAGQQARTKRAGTRLRGGTGTLQAATRHSTRSFALLYSGWELEYWWKVSDEPKELEAAWKMSLAFSRALSVATATQFAA